MNILILSRNSNLYSTRSLLEAGRRRGHIIKVADHMQCDVVSGAVEQVVYYRQHPFRSVDAIIPRIGASATSYGAIVIRQFMLQGVYSILAPVSLLQSRNKFASLQLLAANDLPVPKTLISAYGVSGQELYDAIGGPPYVIKTIRSTHGEGVYKANSVRQALRMMSDFMRSREQVLVQEFVKESNGEDLRIFVVGGEIVAQMKRVAAPGDFRSNLHRGGKGFQVTLSEEEKRVAIRATEVMGLEVAGIDILRSKNGPLLLEVNASPGLEGIETVTGIDIAGRIIELIEYNCKI